MKITMTINIKELKFTIKMVSDNKRPDLLAHASLIFVDEHERHFVCNGFTIRKSKYDGNSYLAPPSKRTEKGFYKFNLVERSLWKEIEREAISKYDYETIPVP